ncbi:hypothetical protein K439DRAFT_1638792 [Ramaria rubella]|nr:hypothetical protein K439DRAFT_1638792 [Ramaria rubella]
MSKTGSGNEDTVPDAYPYYWCAGKSDLSIEEFTKKYKPSMVQNDGNKPWLWVRNMNIGGNDAKREESVKEAKEILVETTDRIQKITDDDSIPVRSNKKTRAKSKKQLKEAAQNEATQKLKDAHNSHDYKSGKWLVFVAPDIVDTVWSRIATSMVTGPLSETVAYLAKVATTPANESSAQRVICIYMPDVFDKEKVTEIMRILLRNHGLNLSGVKSNLYTEIGLDSKHSSRIQSTIWKNTDLLKDSEIKELKDAFYAGLKVEKVEQEEPIESGTKKMPRKPKPVEDDPFGSSEDEEPKSKELPSDVNKTTSKRKHEKEDVEDEDRPTKKKHEG